MPESHERDYAGYEANRKKLTKLIEFYGKHARAGGTIGAGYRDTVQLLRKLERLWTATLRVATGGGAEIIEECVEAVKDLERE